MVKFLRDAFDVLNIDDTPVEAQLATQRIGDIRIDSRAIVEGDLFIATRGVNGHGIVHAADALKRGACAVVSDCPPEEVDSRILVVDDLSHRCAELALWRYGDAGYPRIVAVTGTNGKTSVAWFIAQLLRANGVHAGYVGTLGAGEWGELQDTGMTTPDIFSVHRILAAARNAGVQWMSVEASSHALDQGRLDGVDIDGAVFTNLSRDHLDYHGSFEAYRNAKAQLFARPELKWSVLNADAPDTAEIALVTRQASQILRYGLENADVTYSVSPNGHGLRVEVKHNARPLTINLGLFGRYQGENVVAALSAIECMLDLSLETIKGVEALTPPIGRMETLRLNDVLFVVDYAHTPAALETALNNLREHLENGRLWAVVGAGGDRDPGKRELMGRIASQAADCIVLTSDNPRSEDPLAIIDDIAAGVSGEAKVIADRGAAIAYTTQHARAGDIVLVAGKGHETYQEVNGKRHFFSDQQQLIEHGAQQWAS